MPRIAFPIRRPQWCAQYSAMRGMSSARSRRGGTWIGKTRLTAPTVLQMGQSLRVGQTVLELRK